ncbi:hypothetical protein [Glutamicibacter sp.]|jgi:hypothetical protein|uniref:hypothetical protein n=1 Tax=Glutamicibacter sp. TaxID=1931995 RepID=UPI002B475E03|nr:hypothetical protein [Glutamicibacter sp.]HJX79182.1 hypothetical protein [Glutamicibacter sp.]
MNNFYLLIFLTAFFASMTILTTIQIVKGQNLESLDLECRTNYHAYCFGDKWQKIVEESQEETGQQLTDPHMQKEKSDIYEDQSFMCKHKNHIGNSTDHEIVCIIIDDDDYMNKQNLDNIMNQFKNDLDTFSIDDIMGEMK